MSEKPKKKIDIKSLRDILTLARGGDPEAQQLLKEFMDLKVPQERTNYPAMIYQQKQTFLLMCADHFGLERDGNGEVVGGLGEPFYRMALYDTLTWRSYKGYFVTVISEMLKQGTDLSKLTMSVTPEQLQEKKHFWQRSKPQGEQIQE